MRSWSSGVTGKSNMVSADLTSVILLGALGYWFHRCKLVEGCSVVPVVEAVLVNYGFKNDIKFYGEEWVCSTVVRNKGSNVPASCPTSHNHSLWQFSKNQYANSVTRHFFC